MWSFIDVHAQGKVEVSMKSRICQAPSDLCITLRSQCLSPEGPSAHGTCSHETSLYSILHGCF